jgi:7-cyano-7-deazaguanine reductase
MNSEDLLLNSAPLGKQSTYISQYQKDLLFTIPRKLKRDEIGIHGSLPFQGQDIWNAFEMSWLNGKGKPIVAAAEFTIPCESPNLIESKSFKLYLNSLNNTSFDSFASVEKILVRDLSEAAGTPVAVSLLPLSSAPEITTRHFEGIYLDNLDITCDTYHTEPGFLSAGHEVVTETVYSDLLKSNCLVTGQPDWGSVQIKYTGRKIQHEGLLKYIVSFRNHNEFHEQCVERIFMDITKYCQPEKLFVYARYTRRGGLDINPYRATHAVSSVKNMRLYRQ